VHKKQILTYLRPADKRPGILINFGGGRLNDDIKPIANSLPGRGIYHAEHRKGSLRKARIRVARSFHNDFFNHVTFRAVLIMILVVKFNGHSWLMKIMRTLLS
jgi:hypothetical protein